MMHSFIIRNVCDAFRQESKVGAYLTFTPHFLSEKKQEDTGAAHEPPRSEWRVCARLAATGAFSCRIMPKPYKGNMQSVNNMSYPKIKEL